MVKKENFASIHAGYGQQIVKIREDWRKAKESSIKSSLVITEDVLITL